MALARAAAGGGSRGTARDGGGARGRGRGRGRGGGRGRGRGRGRSRHRRSSGPPAERVKFTRALPPPEELSVAIIGGGAAGCACAAELARAGVAVALFDTGRHGVGGRLATRAASDGSLPAGQAGAARAEVAADPALRFDHACQLFAATGEAGRDGFQEAVERWVDEGLVRQYDAGAVGCISLPETRTDGGAAGKAEAGKESAVRGVHDEPLEGTFYYGAGGMRSVAGAMLEGYAEGEGAQVSVVAPCWVGRMEATEAGWALHGEGKARGTYDAVVISHNGKCANALLKPSGAPDTFELFRRLRLGPVWVALVAFESGVELAHGAGADGAGYEAAFVRGAQALGFAADQGSKIGGCEKGSSMWALYSRGDYAKKNKVPQERVSQSDADGVLADLLTDFEVLAGGELPSVRYSFCQLWGAALPLNATSEAEYALDAPTRVAACGDWLGGGASVGDAWRSGRAAARALVALAEREAAGGAPSCDEQSVALGDTLRSVTADAATLGLRGARG